VEQIKLVIWDLDDTLWSGTISEGPIEHITRNHDIVVALAQRGVISSICSMNDKSVALAELQKSSMADYFVLPSIDWSPKGPRIRQLIEDLNLRPTNVLFIDDLAKNLEEARFVCPDLNVALPEILDTLLDNPAVAGKPDPALKRLKQYKVLEHKISEQSAFHGDTNEFLRQSDINVTVLPPTENDLERLEDLINRSNQLNFTKLRVDQSTLAEYVNPTDSTTGAVWVSDKYGDYGLAGFYALQDGALTQFAFSCRILGFGVESWLYQKLNCPPLEISGEVSAILDRDTTIDWIAEVASRQERVESNTATERLLIKGGCDLRQLNPYLRAEVAIDEEMNYVTQSGFSVHVEHTEILKRANPEFVNLFTDIIDRIPFIDRDAYETEFFSNKHRFKLYSVLEDYTQAIYRYRETEFVVPHKRFTINLLTQEDFLEKRFGKNFADWFIDNFRFEGPLSEEAFEANLEWMIDLLPEGVQLILLNGAEVDLNSEKEPGRHLRHRTYNAIVDRVVARHSNVSLVDVRGIVTDPSHTTNSIRHYQRSIYPILASRVDDVLLAAGVTLKEHIEVHEKAVESPKENKRSRPIMKRLKITSQQLRFLAVGGFNTAFNWLVFSALVWSFGHDFYLWALAIMYAVGSVVGFVLYRRFVFSVTGSVLKDVARFQLVSFGPFVFNIFFLMTLIGWLRFDPVVGQTIFVVLNSIWSFLGHKYFSFRR
jgi:FkbH-like protein